MILFSLNGGKDAIAEAQEELMHVLNTLHSGLREKAGSGRCYEGKNSEI